MRLHPLVLALPLVVAGAAVQVQNKSMIQVRGRVVDARDSTRAVRGAIVALADGRASTYTDSNGTFVLRAARPARQVQLLVRFIGYHPSKLSLALSPDSVYNVGTVKLEQMPIQLEDLVVTRHPPDTARVRKPKTAAPKKP
jgi:carboxypeptidase-like protein